MFNVKMILGFAISTLTGLFPEFAPLGADIQADIASGAVTTANVIQVVTDAATGLETLLPADKQLIIDGITVFNDGAKFIEDILATK